MAAPIYAVFCATPVAAGSAVSTFNPWIIYGLIGFSVALLAAGLALRKRRAAGAK